MAAFASLLVLGASEALGQAPGAAPPEAGPPAKELAFGGSVDVRWVLVPVVVRSPKGWVKGLDANDFTLMVDGRTVSKPSFETGADAPVDLLFLQDLSGSIANGGKIEASRDLMACFLANARPPDRFALVIFDGHGLRVLVPPTSDPEELRRAVAAWQPWGTTALHDAVGRLPELGLELLSGASKKVVVLVTDGVDNASTFTPETARELVRRAEVPVYVLGLGTGSPYVLSPKGGKLFRFADVLNLLAHHTGGRYEPITHVDDVPVACQAVVTDLRHQYVLSFPTRADGKGVYHRIEVKVRGSERRVSHRRGYLGGIPALR